jgi:type II secretory pathway pseudopilin PulG
MVPRSSFAKSQAPAEPAAFSLVELMASVAAMGIVLSGVFTLLYQSQKHFQSSTVTSESNQSARGALEVMMQEIGQAGINPQFTGGKTSSSALTPNATTQCITLSDITGINPGDWVGVDTGAYYELAQVVATSSAALSGQTTCSGAKQISALFEQCHNNTTITGAACSGRPSPCPSGPPCLPWPYPVTSYKFSYPGGILLSQTVSYNGSNISVSNDHILAMFYGDTDNSGTVWYVVYTLYNPTSSTPQSTSINLNGTATTFYLYTLYRSVTQVTFATGATVTHACPLVDNVLYESITGANPVGPTGQPIFSYPEPVQVTVIPSTISVVGTVVINISVMGTPTVWKPLE